MHTSKNLAAWNRLAPRHESTIDQSFLDHLQDLPRGAFVLDVGCGYGRILGQLRKAGFSNTVGIDGAAGMAERCAQAGHIVITGGASQLPFRAESVDCILCVATLSSISHGRERTVVFDEFARVLCPGGRLIIADFTRTYSARRLLRYIRYFVTSGRWGNFQSDGVEFHHFSLKELQRAAEASGLAVAHLNREQYVTMHGRPCNGAVLVGLKPRG